MQPRLRAGGSNGRGTAGFTLVETLAVLLIVTLATMVAWPALLSSASPPRLTAVAEEVATYLRLSRTVALRTGRETATYVDAARRQISAGGDLLQVDAGIDVAVLAADSCQKTGTRVGVVFHGDGSSCGAVIRVSHAGSGYRIRVNWYTGHVAVLRI